MRKVLSSLTIAILVSTVMLGIQPVPVGAQMPTGIPRGDILVFGSWSKSAVADDMNFWKPANPSVAFGTLEPIWYINVTNMQIVSMQALGPPQYSDNFTTMRILVRPGVYWNDGVEFTADDIVFTIMLHVNVTGLSWSAYMQTWVQTAYKDENYTAVIKLKKPNPLFHFNFMTNLGFNGLLIMPKHIWQGKDPLKFTNNPPVDTGPYKVESYDPNGYWAIFKRRDDWERSATGKVLGKPKPKYLLRIYFSPQDPKQIIPIAKHEMDWTEVDLEMLSTVKSANPYMGTFLKDYPYAWQYGICDHGPCFPNDKYPFNITDVRWALTLAINITEVNILTFNGMGRPGTFRSLSVPYIQKQYESILLPLIKNFTLPDGYKPFDDTMPQKMANYAKSQGYTLAADPVTIWGPGWWKYDPAKAEELLKKHGFYKDKAGMWRKPNGDLWTIDYVVGSGIDPHYIRISLGVVEQWRRFGIDIFDEYPTQAVWSSRYNSGDYDAITSNPFCQGHIQVWQWWQGLHERYYKPTGTMTTSNQIRWVNHKVSELLDQLSALSPEDPKVKSIVSEILMESFKDMPAINIFLGSRMIAYDNYVWTNWPTGDNWYWEMCFWNPVWMSPILVKVEPTGKVPSSEYGVPAPVTPPAIPAELNATITSMAKNVAVMNQTITTIAGDLTRLRTEVLELRGTLGTMNTLVTAEVAIIAILGVALVLALLKKRT